MLRKLESLFFSFRLLLTVVLMRRAYQHKC